MKPSFTLLAALFFLGQINAQITILRADYTLEIGDDVRSAPPTNPQDVTIPTTGENMIWDYTNLQFDTDDIEVTLRNPAGSDPQVPEANVINTFLAGGVLPGTIFEATFYRLLDDDGFRYLARKSGALDVGIGAVTGVPTDSLNFLETLDIYEEELPICQFPMHYGDVLPTINFTVSNDFLVTAQGFGLDHAPAQSKFYSSYEISISGWGTLRVNDPTTGEPVELEVLLQEVLESETDSFFLAGMPAPPTLLGAFGLVQDAKSQEKCYEFWAKGLNSPALIIFEFSDGTRTARVNPEVGGFISSTRKVAREYLPVAVSPNPANGHFQLQFEKTEASPWVFECSNLLGQTIQQEVIDLPAGTVNVPVVTASGQTGLHAFVLKNAKGVVVASGKIMLQ